jgi:hypothetical protein
MKHLIKSNGQYFTLDEHGNPQEAALNQIQEKGMDDIGILARRTDTRLVVMSHEGQLGRGHKYRALVNQRDLTKVRQLPVINYEYVKLGALYYDGVELARPTRPWRNNEAFDGEYGNIPARHGDMSKYSFGPATSEETVLYWHKFIDQNKTLLICDRNIVRSISWNHLDGAGFIFGKEIKLDGQRYKCRVLTGGAAHRSGGTGESFEGGQLPNEWDRYVMNGADVGEPHFAYAPIPVPEDYPGTNIFNDQTAWARAHNQAWNWISMGSWCQETSGSLRVTRGSGSARYWNAGSPGNASTPFGWRPVLELIQS